MSIKRTKFYPASSLSVFSPFPNGFLAGMGDAFPPAVLSLLAVSALRGFISDNVIVANEFSLLTARSISSLGFYVSVGAAVTVDFGIFDSSLNLICHTGAVDCSVAGAKIITFPTVNLPVDNYQFAFTFVQSGITTLQIIAMGLGVSFFKLFQTNIFNHTRNRFSTCSASAVAGVLPSNLGVLSSYVGGPQVAIALAASQELRGMQDSNWESSICRVLRRILTDGAEQPLDPILKINLLKRHT